MYTHSIDLIGHDDGSSHYEIWRIASHNSAPPEYRTICSICEDTEHPGQALTDAHLISTALNHFKPPSGDLK